MASAPNGLEPRAFSAGEEVDRLALQHLVAAYAHGVDRRDYALLQTLYHDDAIDDHSPYFHGPASDYIAWLPSMLGNWSATAHAMLTMLFVIDGDRAEGEVSARAWHRTLDGARDFIAFGRYADRYEKRDGVWRFALRSFILDYAEERPVDVRDSFGTDGVGVARPGGDDPVYARLGLRRRPRAAHLKKAARAFARTAPFTLARWR